MPPYPKQKRIVDPMLVKKVRSYGICFLTGRGECWGHLEVHHIETRGSGGDDVEDNLILLCWYHHVQAQARLIDVETLRTAQGYANRRRLKLLGGNL